MLKKIYYMKGDGLVQNIINSIYYSIKSKR